MDTKLIDIFVSYSSADAARVEPWIKRLRKGGVVVWHNVLDRLGPRRRRISAREATRSCEVLIWFTSKFSSEAEDAGRLAAEATRNNKAVLVVTLDTAPAPALFDLSLPRVSTVDLLLVGRQATWEGILKAVRDQGIPWIPPGTKRRLSSQPNQRRSIAHARALLRMALAAGLLLLAGSLAFTHFKMGSRTASPSLPPAPAPPPVTQPKPLLTVTADLPPSPPRSPMSAQREALNTGT